VSVPIMHDDDDILLLVLELLLDLWLLLVLLWVDQLALESSSTTAWWDEGSLEGRVSLVCGEVDKGFLHRLVLQVDGGSSRNAVDGVDLSVVGLFGSSQEKVDEGSFSGSRLESSLDQFFDLVVGHFDINNLLGSFGSLEPEDVLRPKSNVVGVHTVAHELETSRTNFLATAFGLQVSTGSTAAATTTTTLGKGSRARGGRAKSTASVAEATSPSSLLVRARSEGCSRSLELATIAPLIVAAASEVGDTFNAVSTLLGDG